jgi:hypothetical protein
VRQFGVPLFMPNVFHWGYCCGENYDRRVVSGLRSTRLVPHPPHRAPRRRFRAWPVNRIEFLLRLFRELVGSVCGSVLSSTRGRTTTSPIEMSSLRARVSRRSSAKLLAAADRLPACEAPSDALAPCAALA